jgi:tripartite-type tricarboxylate transporter receptor subunit TctC
LQLAAGAAALPVVPGTAWAAEYPTRPVRVIVPTFVGGTPDIVARLMSKSLSERLGQQFIVENRTGAGAKIGTEAVVRAPADGYSLLFVTQSNAIDATLYDKLNFNFVRDIAPVVGIGRVPLVIVVNPSSIPTETVPEFIAYAKANPGRINMASGGVGNPPHVAGVLFQVMTGVDLVHVQYRGGYLPDLLAGQVQVAFSPIPTVIEYIRAGKLRALGVTSVTRSQALPDIATVGEFVPGYEAGSWYGIGAPTNTPAEIVNALNTAINVCLADPKMKVRFAELGVVPMPMTPTEFGTFIGDETEKWAKIIRAGNIKAE